MDKEIKKDVHDEMKDIFANINSWLNFAEVKNSALVVLNIALLIGMFENSDQFESGYFNIIMSTILISSLLALISFFPIIQNTVLKYKIVQRIIKRKRENKNLIFYGNITNHYTTSNTDEYVKDLYKEYFHVDISVVEKRDKDLAEEIIINSWIAEYKYYMFKSALIVLYIPVGMLIMTFLCG